MDAALAEKTVREVLAKVSLHEIDLTTQPEGASCKSKDCSAVAQANADESPMDC